MALIGYGASCNYQTAVRSQGASGVARESRESGLRLYDAFCWWMNLPSIFPKTKILSLEFDLSSDHLHLTEIRS